MGLIYLMASPVGKLPVAGFSLASKRRCESTGEVGEYRLRLILDRTCCVEHSKHFA